MRALYLIAPFFALASTAAAAPDTQGPPHPEALAEVGSTQVFFPKNSAYLRQAEAAKVRKVAAALGRLPGQTLKIHGLTDPFGDPDFNDWLRGERSAAVHKALVEAGVEEAQMELAEPLERTAGNSEPTHRLRRVEFSLEGLVLPRPAAGETVAEEDVPAEVADAPITDDHGPPHPGALALVATTQIYFPKSSADLRGEEVEKLRALATAFARLPGQTLSVRGLTDPRGNAKFNDWLRGERSTAVRQRLAALGVPEVRMSEGAPRATTNAVAQSREKMRRVEFGIDGLHAVGVAAETAEGGVGQTPAAPTGPPRYGTISRRDRGRLAELIEVADATEIHFEFAGYRVRREYHRELWSLASAVLETDDGAVELKAFAAHGLPVESREEIGQRRALAIAALLQQMGLDWRHLRIAEEVGVSSPDALPNWRDHRVEFTAIRSLPPEGTPESVALAPVDDVDPKPAAVELETGVASGDDPLATLVAEAIIYFGGNSAKVRLSDKRKLRRIAERALRDGGSRRIAVTAVTDRFGNADYNRSLGERRQAAVIDILRDAGLPPERLLPGEITTTPAGESGPSWKQRRAQLRLQ